MKLKTLVPALAVVVFANGCGGSGEPAGPQTARARVEATLPGLATSAEHVVSSMDESAMLANLGQSIGAIETIGSTEETLARLAAGDPQSEDSGIDLAGLAEALNEQVFTDQNYEGDGLYLLGPDLLCDAEDIECPAQVIAAEIRVRADVAGDGLDIALLIGPAKHEPVFVELRSDRLEVSVDLAETKAAINHIASVTELEVELPETFSGVLAGSLSILDQGVVRVALGIPETVNIAGTIEGLGAFSFSAAAGDPVLAITASADGKDLTVDADVRPTHLSLPWQAFSDASESDDALVIDIEGLSFSMTIDDVIDSLLIDNIGLGDDTTTVSLGGQTLLSIDLNRDSGRRFSVSVDNGPVGPRLTFDPELDLEVYVNLFDPDGIEEMPAELVDTNYRLELEGATPTLEIIAGELDDTLSVASGTLRLTVNDEFIEVAAGECVLADPVLDGEHPILGAIAAGNCPL